MTWERVLALIGIVPAGGTPYFFVFWRWFDFWRARRRLWMAMFVALFGTFIAFLLVFDELTFAGKVAMPAAARLAGVILLIPAWVFGFVADRQIGVRVRSFAPFFDVHGKLELKTSGAYGVVRHPIYAAAIWESPAIFLITGYPAVLAAGAIFGGGALWFTKREEERLMTLLDDPGSYESYRQRVPAIFPRLVTRKSG